jgi:hypothetical protein
MIKKGLIILSIIILITGCISSVPASEPISVVKEAPSVTVTTTTSHGVVVAELTNHMSSDYAFVIYLDYYDGAVKTGRGTISIPKIASEETGRGKTYAPEDSTKYLITDVAALIGDSPYAISYEWPEQTVR